MNINNQYDYTPRMYTLSDIIEGRVTIPEAPPLPPDSYIKAAVEIYNETQKENKKIFLEHIFDPSKKYIDKFLSLPEYGDYILPFLTDKKPAELEYLYKLATEKDKNGELRIPGICFPFFSEIPEERLKMLEPIITSKNFEGGWNYSPSYITSLDKYSDPQLEYMTKLAKLKVNRYYLEKIACIPPFILDRNKLLEKAETLNKLYGDDLKDFGIFVNDKNEFYIRAKISLNNKNEKTNVENDKEVYAHIDLALSPAPKEKNENLDSIVERMSKNIETKLCLFTEKDFVRIGCSIQAQIPTATVDEILIVMQKLTQFANYSCLRHISDELQKLNIGKIPAVGDINPYFDYFGSSKKLFPLSQDDDAKFAFFITKKDINNKREMAFLKEWLKKGEFKNIKFINLEGWSDGVNLLTDDNKLEEKTKQVILKAKKLMQKDKYLTFTEAVGKVLNQHIETTMKNLGADITTISIDAPPSKSVILDQMKPYYPSAGILKSTIESISENYTPNEKFQKGLQERLAKYFDENLNVYSKQSIIENLKIIHSKINNYLEENKRPKENLYFITPKKGLTRKSFELITKMYAELYNVPEEKIIHISDICALNTFPENSTFVVLDDIVGTGKSMTNVGEYMFYGDTVAPDKHILFAPISGTDFGIAYLRGVISSLGRQNRDKVIYIDTNIKQYTNLKDVFKNLYYKIDNPSKYSYGPEGFDSSSQCTAFPYMTPDNNSVIASDITKYFVSNYSCIKNPNTDLLKIEKDAYRNNIFGANQEEKFYNIFTDYYSIP